MTEYRRYCSTRQLVDVDDFLAKRASYYVMCVSEAQLYALRKMAKTRLLWQTSWAKERYEQTYSLPDVADWDLIEEHISEWIRESETVKMCNQQMVSALEGIAEAVRLSSCCWGAGPGIQYVDDVPYWGTEEGVDEPTVFGPSEEFETEEAYLDHKCETANGIINGLIGTISSISALSLVGVAASALLAAVVGIGLIFAPPVVIVLAVLSAGLTTGFLYTLATEIETNREDLVCLLYGATTAIEAYDSLKDAIETISIDIGVAEIAVGTVTDLVMTMAPIDTMNKLFQAVGLPEIPGDTVDCATACGDQCPIFEIVYGSGDIPLLDVPATMNSEYTGGLHQIRFRIDEAQCSCDDQNIEVTGYSGISANHSVAVTLCSGSNSYYDQDGPLTGFIAEHCGRQIWIQSTTACTLSYVVNSGGC